MDRGDLCPMSSASVKYGGNTYGFKAPKRGDRLMFIYLGVCKKGENFNPDEYLKAMGWTPPETIEPEPTIMEKFYQDLTNATGIILNGTFTSRHLSIYDPDSIKEGEPICRAVFKSQEDFCLYKKHVNSATSYNEKTKQLRIFYYGKFVDIELF